MKESFESYGIKIPYRRTTGSVKCTCPQCSSSRGNPRDKSLSVNLDKGVWLCHHCNWKGGLKDYTPHSFVPKEKVYARPQSAPKGALSEKMIRYLNSRGISFQTALETRLAEGMEFMPQASKEMNTLQFCYYVDGELINIKYRTGNKFFKLYKDAELVPYNIDSIKDTDECVITEGEFDALSFVEAGFKSAVSVPAGANANLTYLDDFTEGWFDNKQTIYIASDTDTKGLELRQALITRFGADRCKIVTYGDDCKDANEHLVKYGKQSLLNCLHNATEVKVDGLFSESDYAFELDELYRKGWAKGKTLGFENFDDLISFESQRLCVVTGVPSSGKSEFIDQICVNLLLRYGWRTAFFSPENMPLTYHAAKLIEKAVGTRMRNLSEADFTVAKRWLNDNFVHILPPNGFTVDNVLELALSAVRRKGVKIVVIDPYNRLESGQGMMSETQYISNVLDKLTNFAVQNDVLVILMAHPRKVTETDGSIRVPTLYDINGSANFYNKADFGIIVHRYRSDNPAENYTLVRVSKVKFRHLGKGGDAFFKFDTACGRYAPYYKDDYSRNQPFDTTNLLTGKPSERPQPQAVEPPLPQANEAFLDPYSKAAEIIFSSDQPTDLPF